MVLLGVGGYCSDSRQGSSRSGLSFIYNSANNLQCINLVLMLRKFVKIMEPCINTFDTTLLNSKNVEFPIKVNFWQYFPQWTLLWFFFKYVLTLFQAGQGQFDPQHHAYVCSFYKCQANLTKIGDFVSVTIWHIPEKPFLKLLLQNFWKIEYLEFRGSSSMLRKLKKF